MTKITTKKKKYEPCDGYVITVNDMIDSGILDNTLDIAEYLHKIQKTGLHEDADICVYRLVRSKTITIKRQFVLVDNTIPASSDYDLKP